MNRLRKIGQWFWFVKERLLLGIMVAVLAYQIFNVLKTEGDVEPPRIAGPRSVVDPELIPGLPPPIPARALQGRLVFDGNFLIYVPESGPGSIARSAEDLGLELLAIQDINGESVARIQTISSTRARWYSAGESFESYEILSIDRDAGECEIYADNLGQTVILSLN